MLLIVWIGAIAGVLFPRAVGRRPRWLYVPVYVALGWVVFYLPALVQHGGWFDRRPGRPRRALLHPGGRGLRHQAAEPSPRWFGFHEVFHTLTILAFVSHYVAASLALSAVSA